MWVCLIPELYKFDYHVSVSYVDGQFCNLSFSNYWLKSQVKPKEDWIKKWTILVKYDESKFKLQTKKLCIFNV